MSDRVTINDSQTCTMAVLRAAGPFGMRGKWRFCWDHFFRVWLMCFPCVLSLCWLSVPLPVQVIDRKDCCPFRNGVSRGMLNRITHTPSKSLCGKTYTINKNRHWYNSSANMGTHSSKHWTMKVMSSIISFHCILYVPNTYDLRPRRHQLNQAR